MKKTLFSALLSIFTVVAIVIVIVITMPSKIVLRSDDQNKMVHSKEKFMNQWNENKIAIETEKQKANSAAGSMDMNSAPAGYDADEWLDWVASLGISAERKKIAEYCLTAYKRKIPYSQNNIDSQRLTETPAFLDCSTMVMNAYWYAGLTPLIGATTAPQINQIKDKPVSEFLTGDSVIYRGSGSGHIMTYIGTNGDGPVWCHAAGKAEGMKLNAKSFDDIRAGAESAGKQIRFGYFPPLAEMDETEDR